MGDDPQTKIAARAADGSLTAAGSNALSLPVEEVHVWTARLDPPDAAVAALGETLQADEEARSARFRFAKDRRSFMVARGSLRVLLGRYLGLPAGKVKFIYGSHGKPALAGAGGDWLRFNVSHSGDLGLFAFARSTDVGVDVEQMRSQPDLDGIAERFFSADEVSALRRLPEEKKQEAFYRCWTAKEAYIKGVGEGLSMPLDRFAVSLEPEEGAIRLRVLDGAAQTGAWRLHRFVPRPGYVGALAADASSFRIRFREWNPGQPGP